MLFNRLGYLEHGDSGVEFACLSFRFELVADLVVFPPFFFFFLCVCRYCHALALVKHILSLVSLGSSIEIFALVVFYNLVLTILPSFFMQIWQEKRSRPSRARPPPHWTRPAPPTRILSFLASNKRMSRGKLLLQAIRRVVASPTDQKFHF